MEIVLPVLSSVAVSRLTVHNVAPGNFLDHEKYCHWLLAVIRHLFPH